MNELENLQDMYQAAEHAISEAASIMTLEKLAAILREQFKCENCLPSCVKRGFKSLQNKHIKIAYEHILGIELSWCSKSKTIFRGFHHDFMNAVEKSGALQFVNKVVYENGCYMADLIIDGVRFPKKNVFPCGMVA